MSDHPLMRPPGAEKKIAAGVCAILLGSFGVHKFVLGYPREGLILLLTTLVGVPLITFLTCGVGSFLGVVVHTIGLIEGIVYLTRTDEEFSRLYIQGYRPWF